MRCNFNPRSPMRGATIVVFDPSLAIIFQSTLPYAGSDQASPFAQIAAAISIHAPLCGERRSGAPRNRGRVPDFNPRSPMRGATDKYFTGTIADMISIHAPLCGERRGRRYLPNGDAKISIHAPLCGERHACNFFHDECFQFQSTLPYAGSDLSKGPETPTPSNFNPRSPMRGATVRPGHFFQRVEISIHAPLCGERPVPFFGLKDLVEFQSTLPYAGSDMCCDAALHSPAISIHAPLCGERPANGNIYLKKLIISIHAPLCGERHVLRCCAALPSDFNPRSPMRGATGKRQYISEKINNFNPRSPMRGATDFGQEINASRIFQSTLPYAGSDHNREHYIHERRNFNPRSPMRGATFALRTCRYAVLISIHAPLCGERPRVATKLGKWFGISIHAPLCGERPRNGEIPERTIQFQSTLPYAGSDSFRTCSSTNITNFNPRSPMRGATVYGRL